MFYDQFLRDFPALGRYLGQWLEGRITDVLLDEAVSSARVSNPFFTPLMQRNALETIVHTCLNEKELSRWLKKYSQGPDGFSPGDIPVAGNALKMPDISRYPGKQPATAPAGGEYEKEINIGKGTGDGAGGGKTVGIIMAGNIPLVGFHDLLCVLAGGCRAVVKMSSKDSRLLPALVAVLYRINAYWEDKIRFVETMPHQVDALIATGTGETAEKVKKAYEGIPMLVRGRRFSWAVLDGKESPSQLRALGRDIFMYFGLGCRSVSYLLVPEKYDMQILKESLRPLRTLVADECYMNIYKRNRAVLTLEGADFIDGGFYIMQPCSEVFLPAGILGYRTYSDPGDILAFERKNSESIQKKYRTFGHAQAPVLDDYADGVDTMKFILNTK